MKGESLYQHQWFDGSQVDLPTGKVVCVGRNYAEHAQELNNPVPTEPLLFMKPASSIVSLEQPVVVKADFGSVHYETEIAVLIGKKLAGAPEGEVAAGISGVGIALDLTLRELQSTLKEKGHPWEKAKGFDGSCPLSAFVPAECIVDWQDVPVQLHINGKLRQSGNSSQMLNGILPLIAYISTFFTLEPGDVVITGTPAGVGQLEPGMQLKAALPGLLDVSTEIV
ncbi:fumarylacetoacetate hydrolase family protein [Sansalvadorimonas verongulae]|uniref:fumarylacetoacetate hydrolase family protein n=1 Tax=Sansalvadorimonas verongulae TaxID=2172824 RepID=UPI0012BC745D|nr:fumarylacetoacetate hydrolase family protein [Sansalvadorimonas verongulae]MTI15326.1 fumarylacetoacetate hydrolase family protein [Sansalvadorimonas verongulae]